MKIGGPELSHDLLIGRLVVEVIDQTSFPPVRDCDAQTCEDAARAILTMQVRGAPLIGVRSIWPVPGFGRRLGRSDGRSVADRPGSAHGINLRWLGEYAPRP